MKVSHAGAAYGAEGVGARFSLDSVGFEEVHAVCFGICEREDTCVAKESVWVGWLGCRACRRRREKPLVLPSLEESTCPSVGRVGFVVEGGLSLNCELDVSGPPWPVGVDEVDPLGGLVLRIWHSVFVGQGAA